MAVTVVSLVACGAAQEPAATPSAMSGTSGAAYPRTVEDSRGPVTLEEAPQRVATVNLNYIGPFLEPFLDEDGVELVGYGTARDIAEYNPWLIDMAVDVPEFDNSDGANLEALAGYRPDLILANGTDDYWQSASQVAPLVNVDDSDWRGATRLLGEVFDAESIAEQTVEETEQLIAAARRADPIEIAILWADSNDGNVTFAYEGAAVANTLTELGLETGPGLDPASGGYETVSLELASERLDVDWVVVLNFSIDADSAGVQEGLLASPILSRIPVVTNGNVIALTPQQTQAGNPAAPTTIPVLIEATERIQAAR
jgi:iron complex transport system substrate-binding protein